jgi:branched-chain amino acid transport system ATP-binding protein
MNPRAKGPPILETAGLWKSFGGVEAVADMSLRVSSGELCAVIGPNGAGKTTLFNLLAGQTRSDRGTIRFAGEDIGILPAYRIWHRGLSRTFQVPATFGSLTTLESVQVGLWARTRSRWSIWQSSRHGGEEARKILARVGLAEKAGWMCGALSVAEVRRLEMAMALSNSPRLLLLDEPAAGLGVEERAALIGLIRELRGAGELAIVFIEHDMDLVFAIAERIVVMHQGRVLADGNPATIRANPAVQRIYLGEDAFEEAEREDGGREQRV